MAKDLKDWNVERSNHIKAFLKRKPEISRNAICAKIGFDTSNLAKYLKNDSWNIPAYALADFEKELKRFGFEPKEKAA